MGNILFVQMTNRVDNLDGVKLHGTFRKLSFLFQHLAKFSSLDEIHDKEDVELVLKSEIHFDQIFMIVCLHNQLFKFWLVNDVIIDENWFS